MTRLLSTAEAPPLWDKLAELVTFPLSLSPLIIISTAALFLLALAFLGQLIALIGAVFVLSFVLKYALSALEQVARGNMEPPYWVDELVSEGYAKLAKLLVVLLIWFAIEFAIGKYFGAYARIAIDLLAAALLPAAIMLLGVSNSLAAALNIGTIVSVIRRIGWTYLGLVVLLFGVTLAAVQMAGLLVDSLKGALMLLAILMVANYFILLAFALMGYLLYQHHEELGIETLVMHQGDESKSRFDKILANIEEGDLDMALNLALGVQVDDAKNPELPWRLYQVMRLRNDRERSREVAPRILSDLIEAKRANMAGKVYTEMIDEIPDLGPLDEAHFLPLAEVLRDQGEPRQALKLIDQVIKRGEKTEQTPAQYLLAARIYAEDLGKDRKALALIDHVMRRFSPQELPSETDTLKRTLMAVQR